MDMRLNSVTFLILLLVSLLCFILSASEARPLHYHSSPSKIIVGEVNGIFRTLKSSGASPGKAHRLKMLQNLGQIKKSGPSPGGGGHKVESRQDLSVTNHSGPSPGEGHKAIINRKHL